MGPAMSPAAPTRLRIAAHADSAAIASDRVRMTFEERTRARLVVRLDSGVEAALALPRGAPLRHGDRLLASDGRIVEVVAAPEPLLHVDVADAALLARAAYHLGNRHVAVELRDRGLRVAHDAVLERLLRGLGLEPGPVDAPFDPEGGAYGQAHAHLGDTSHPAPVIHEYRRS
jgi:urease accessory protein